MDDRASTSRGPLDIRRTDQTHDGPLPSAIHPALSYVSVNFMLCLGAAHIDETITTFGPLNPATSNPAAIATTCGGVAFNVALGLAVLGHNVALGAAIGDDADGARIRKTADRAGIDTRPFLVRPDHPTGRYVAALHPSGDLAYGFADTRACETLTSTDMATMIDRRECDAIWFVDTNLPDAVLTWIATRCPPETMLIADTVSIAKAPKVACLSGRLSLLRTNRAEAEAIINDPDAPLVLLARALADRMAAPVVLTDGPNGTVVVSGPDRSAPAWFVPAPAVTPIDVTGAGDAATAGIIHALATGHELIDAVVIGHAAAAYSLSRAGAGIDGLKPAMLADAAASAMPYLDL